MPYFRLILPLLVAVCATMHTSYSKEWLFQHSNRSDFANGQLSNSGQNLYLPADGGIRWIHRFDIDGNGYPDLVIPNDHNHYDTPPAILYQQHPGKGFTSLVPVLHEDMPLYEVLEHYQQARPQQLLLPVQGGSAAAVGDFNGDGKADIAVSAFVHGWNTETFPLVIFPMSQHGYSAEQRVSWDLGFVAGVTAADLDGDGIDDLIAAGRGPEYEVARNQILPRDQREQAASNHAKASIVVFGDPELSMQRQVKLDTLYAIDVASADLNNDGHADLVFLEAGEPAYISIWTNDGNGQFDLATDPISVGPARWDVVRGRKIHLADLDNDGLPEILVPTTDGLRILWNQADSDFSESSTTLIPASHAYAVTTGDFNGNGLPDLAIARFDPAAGHQEHSLVLLNNGESVESWQQLELPTHGANAITTADLDNNGYDDLIVAQFMNPQTRSLDTFSLVFKGSEDGLHPARSVSLATFGAVDVVTVPSQTEPLQDILFINRQSGRRGFTGGPTDGGAIPLYIYWGNPTGSYSTVDMSKLPPATPETPILITDLNADGDAELITLTDSGRKVSIYTIRNRQFELLRQLHLPNRSRLPMVADLNKDGILDLIVPSTKSGHVFHFADPLHGPAAPLAIEVPFPAYSAILGDISGNGYLDLVASGVDGIYLLPGNSEGFDSSSVINTDSDKFFTKVTLADFNNDGTLDALAFAWRDNSTEINRTDSLIFHNREGTLDFTAPYPVPTFGGAHQGAVVDLNQDEGLSVVSSNYHGGDTRHLDLQILHGDSQGNYSLENAQNLPAWSASAVQAMDFNQDGYTDLLVFNHSESTEVYPDITRGGRHSVGARIYWGGADGFSENNYSWIPTYGPHNKLNIDPGSIDRRQPVEYYTSEWIEFPPASRHRQLVLIIEADLQHREAIQLQLRNKTDQGEWQTVELSPQDNGSWHSAPLTLPETGAIQYRLELDSNFLGRGPNIHSVTGRLE